jgi:hypothetical protein
MRKHYISTSCNDTFLRRINIPYTNTRKGTRETDFTRIIIYSPLKKTQFYSYHFILPPYIILQLIFILWFILYIISKHTRIYVKEIPFLKALSTVYWNIRALQPEDRLRMEAETRNCHYLLFIILYIHVIKWNFVRLSNYINFKYLWTQRGCFIRKLQIIVMHDAIVEIFGNDFYLFVYVKVSYK